LRACTWVHSERILPTYWPVCKSVLILSIP